MWHKFEYWISNFFNGLFVDLFKNTKRFQSTLHSNIWVQDKIYMVVYND